MMDLKKLTSLSMSFHPLKLCGFRMLMAIEETFWPQLQSILESGSTLMKLTRTKSIRF